MSDEGMTDRRIAELEKAREDEFTRHYVERDAARTEIEALRKQLVASDSVADDYYKSLREAGEKNEALRKRVGELEAELAETRVGMALAKSELDRRESELVEVNTRWCDMIEVAKANGFESLTDAITRAKYSEKSVERNFLDQQHNEAIALGRDIDRITGVLD